MRVSVLTVRNLETEGSEAEGSEVEGSETVAKLVFSDLDGSLLDHHTYSFAAAKPALDALAAAHIPLVLVSSKTCAEILAIRGDLHNDQAFIVENGAAVFVPKALSKDQPASTIEFDDFWVFETVEPRQHWLDILARVGESYEGLFETFHGAGVDGICRLTGLSRQAATAANERGYSEPVAWLGDAAEKAAFIAELTTAGATVQQGGRFLSVSGACDKGRALQWLRQLYQSWLAVDEINDIAIGDSQNDCAMLEVAGTALLIKSPNHTFPALQRNQRVIRSQAEGPTGWSEGVLRWLKDISE